MSVAKVEKWGIFELTFKGHIEGNPFIEAEIKADFCIGGRKTCVNGFYNGNDEYKIRFMPDALGVWEYKVFSNVKKVNAKEGTFECTKPLEGNHGPVRVIDKYHFAYEDGTPHHPIGTTCYVWNHQTDELEKKRFKH